MGGWGKLPRFAADPREQGECAFGPRAHCVPRPLNLFTMFGHAEAHPLE